MEKVIGETFRSAFKTVSKDSFNWYPGHMDKGMKKMQLKLRSIDCVIEVHDARIPLSGRNTNFKQYLLGVKPHILVLNKVDLIEAEHVTKIRRHMLSLHDHVVFTNCKSQTCGGIRKLFPLAQELISKSDRYNRASEEDYCIMVIGVPNVGKSSLLNALRVKYLKKGNATHVGATPGITRSVLTKIRICEKPQIFMLDTPGILTPSIPNCDVGLKLALCATTQDHLVGEETIADYLLYWLNKQKCFGYVDHFGLRAPSDDILEVLSQISINRSKMLKIKDANHGYVMKPDLNNAAKVMIKAFRSGELGKIMLDDDILL